MKDTTICYAQPRVQDIDINSHVALICRQEGERDRRQASQDEQIDVNSEGKRSAWPPLSYAIQSRR
jgi:hypothetical protein